MDLLKREMERKRKALLDAKQRQGERSGDAGGRRRYVKAEELRRWVEEDAAAKEDEKQSQSVAAARNATLNDKEQQEQTEPSESVSTLPVIDSLDDESSALKKQKKEHHQRKGDDGDDNKNAIRLVQKPQKSLSQLMKELRSFGLPITLFGERTAEERWVRLEQAAKVQAVVQLNETEANEFRLGQGHSIRNPFLERDGENDILATTNTSKKSGEAPIDNDDAEIDDKQDDDDPHKFVYRHFKGLLRQWEADLNERSDDFKRSLAGRNERKTVKQCKDYIRPLFQLCKRRKLEENLLQKLFQMVQFCKAGEFVRAHDAYLDVAIGRAAWPIGVTMVGIHARSGRAKIESSNVAHVMNSELQRKYLTSVKRLLTYEQTKRSDVDPSKKVLH